MRAHSPAAVPRDDMAAGVGWAERADGRACPREEHLGQVSHWPPGLRSSKRGELLASHILRAAHEPFCWGILDCWLFAADWVYLVRGYDAAAHLRGRYATQRACLRLLIAEGARTYLDIARMGWQRAGLEEIAPADLRIGDVAAVASPRGHFGAISTGRGLVAKIGAGLWWGAVPSSKIAAGWRV
jgi:hypothetical protein